MKIDNEVWLNALDARTKAARIILTDMYSKSAAGRDELPTELVMQGLNMLEEICTLYTGMREHENR